MATPRVLVDFAEPIPVSTLRTLVEYTEWDDHDLLLFAVINMSEADPVTVLIDTSEDGVADDQDSHAELAIQPGKQGSLEIGPLQTRRFFRLTAHTAEPDYPTALVKWTIKGMRTK